jgi:hypothetical protein
MCGPKKEEENQSIKVLKEEEKQCSLQNNGIQSEGEKLFRPVQFVLKFIKTQAKHHRSHYNI